MAVSKKEISECPVDAMMRVIDGRWKGTILWRLQDGPKRTSELKRSIPGITERMLIRHLQEFVADGILKRDDKKTIPPCVYYSLSSYGRTLGPVVEMMCNWGRSHLRRLSSGSYPMWVVGGCSEREINRRPHVPSHSSPLLPRPLAT